MPSGSCAENESVSKYLSRWTWYLSHIPPTRKQHVFGPCEVFNVLVHPAGEVILGESAARLVVGAPIGLDAFQITGDNVLALS